MNNPAVIAELKRIAAENDGVLLPERVVDAARSQASPLHSWFEWDDARASAAYRIWQARQLLSVTVEYVGIGDNAKMSRVFVSLKSDRKDGGYRTMVSVMSDAERRQQLMEDARQDMETFTNKYAELKELQVVFDAMRASLHPARKQRKRAALQPQSAA